MKEGPGSRPVFLLSETACIATGKEGTWQQSSLSAHLNFQKALSFPTATVPRMAESLTVGGEGGIPISFTKWSKMGLAIPLISGVD